MHCHRNLVLFRSSSRRASRAHTAKCSQPREKSIKCTVTVISMIADCLRLAILPTIGGNFPFRRSLKRYFKYCNGEEDMGNARTTYLTGLTLTSLFAVGSVLVAQAAPADYRYSSHRHHYGHY